MTTGTGDYIANGAVSHNCFARPSHTYLNFDAGRDFETKIVVKVNAPELLRRELAARKWSGAHIAMGTNVDCYQRAEGRYRLMPAVMMFAKSTNGLSHCKEEDTPEPYLEQTIEAFLKLVQKTVAL